MAPVVRLAFERVMLRKGRLSDKVIDKFQASFHNLHLRSILGGHLCLVFWALCGSHIGGGQGHFGFFTIQFGQRTCTGHVEKTDLSVIHSLV